MGTKNYKRPTYVLLNDVLGVLSNVINVIRQKDSSPTAGTVRLHDPHVESAVNVYLRAVFPHDPQDLDSFRVDHLIVKVVVWVREIRQRTCLRGVTRWTHHQLRT